MIFLLMVIIKNKALMMPLYCYTEQTGQSFKKSAFGWDYAPDKSLASFPVFLKIRAETN
jgi:hypothetical protein